MKVTRSVIILAMTLVCSVVIALPAYAAGATVATQLQVNIGAILPRPVLSVLVTVLAIIMIDTVLGILVSIKNGEFDIRKVPRFLATNVLPYIGGLLILALGSTASIELATIYYGAAAATSVKFIAEIKDKVKEIFGQGVVKVKEPG